MMRQSLRTAARAATRLSPVAGTELVGLANVHVAMLVLNNSLCAFCHRKGLVE